MLARFEADVEPLRAPAARSPPSRRSRCAAATARCSYANAGAGKTLVLVERFVRDASVEDEHPPRLDPRDHVHRKAAGELRTRVRSALRRARRARPRARGRGARGSRRSTASARASCAATRVAAGLDPAFAVLDEAQSRVLQAEAFDEALRRCRRRARRRRRADAARRLRLRRACARPSPRSTGCCAAAAPRCACRRSRPAPRGRPRSAPRSRAAAPRRRGARSTASRDARTLSALAAVRALRRAARRRSARATCPTPAALKALVAGGGTKALECAACQAYDDALAAYRDGAAGRTARTRLWPLADELLRGYAAAYAERQARARRALDFDDLELRTRDLLRDDAGGRAAVARALRRVMVDEFQDTNPLQLADPRALGARRRVHGRRRAPVDLRLPPRRRRGLPRAAARALRPRAAPCARWPRTSAREPAILDALNAAFAPLWPRDFVDAACPGAGPRRRDAPPSRSSSCS